MNNTRNNNRFFWPVVYLQRILKKNYNMTISELYAKFINRIEKGLYSKFS